MVWCALWWFLVYDSPVQHPRISDEEKQYILEAIGDKVHQGSSETKVSTQIHFKPWTYSSKWDLSIVSYICLWTVVYCCFRTSSKTVNVSYLVFNCPSIDNRQWKWKLVLTYLYNNYCIKMLKQIIQSFLFLMSSIWSKSHIKFYLQGYTENIIRILSW